MGSNKLILITLLLLLSSISTFAGGAGGLYYGNYNNIEQFSNNDMGEAYYYGGHGYGTNRDGVRSGGFGMVIVSENDNDGEGDGNFHSAFGGVITGKEVEVGPIVLAANIWAGAGYSPVGFSGVGELTLDAGLTVLPWMQIQFYGGIQGIAAFRNLTKSSTYTPVVGVRIVWGSF